MKETKTLTVFLFISFFLFLIMLLGALSGLAIFFKNIEWIYFLVIFLPCLVIGGISLLIYFWLRNKINKIEEENKKVSEETKQ